MSPESLHRYRIRYSKRPSIRFIGHLDLLRTWERALRRAQIPMAFTQGFHPHPRINLGAALPLGYSSECELMDLWIENGIEPTEIMSRISRTLPPGIELGSVEPIPATSPSLQKSIRWAEYLAVLDQKHSVEEMKLKVSNLLDQDTLQRKRRGKTYDLRPLLHSLEVIEIEGRATLRMTLSSSQQGTGRPDEVLDALRLDALLARIQRKRLILNDEGYSEMEAQVK